MKNVQLKIGDKNKICLIAAGVYQCINASIYKNGTQAKSLLAWTETYMWHILALPHLQSVVQVADQVDVGPGTYE